VNEKSVFLDENSEGSANNNEIKNDNTLINNYEKDD
jgi:hypothetical protein